MASSARSGKACTCKYLNISLLRQQPKRWMMSVSTLAQRRAMAPLALQERIEMSTAEIPYAAPITVVVRRSWNVKVVLSMVHWCRS